MHQTIVTGTVAMYLAKSSQHLLLLTCLSKRHDILSCIFKKCPMKGAPGINTGEAGLYYAPLGQRYLLWHLRGQ
jgi:hypothetical protein